jgi:UDP-2,4-diacetamido-2,4,6-trideoxy-beta-L-altropyranose hydrolase
MKPHVYLRANGNGLIGLGHIIRIKSLKNMIDDVFDCVYLLREEDKEAIAILEDAPQLLIPKQKDLYSEAHWLSANCLTGKERVVLDGYLFDTEYQQIIRENCLGLIFIDDIRAFHYVADLVINHVDGFTPADYDAEAYTQFLLGFKYSILRPQFIAQAQQAILPKTNKNVLMCLGGADPENTTQQLLEQILPLYPEFSFQIVVGAVNPNLETLKSLAQNSSSSIQVFYSLNEMEMAELMKNAAIAVLSPSTVALEYLCSGGSLYLYPIADNQMPLNNLLIKKGYARPFRELINLDTKSPFFFKDELLIDGKSPARICEAIQSLK